MQSLLKKGEKSRFSVDLEKCQIVSSFRDFLMPKIETILWKLEKSSGALKAVVPATFQKCGSFTSSMSVVN